MFLRSNRGVTLTTEGEKLFRHVEIAFENISKAENELVAERSLDGGLISVATTEIGLYGSVLPALTAFKADYPGVKFKLTNLNSPQSIEAVKNGVADFAVVTLHDKIDACYRVRKIRDFNEILCCKKGFNEYKENLIACPYISVNRNSYSYKFCQDYLLSCGINKVPDIEVATADQILPLIKAGIGIGFVSEFLAADALAAGTIKEIPLKNPPRKRSICLVEDKKRSLSLVASEFVKYLQNEQEWKKV